MRVVVPDMGGGFGAKSRTYPEELALGVYARRVGRPVRWTETRSENMVAMPHGRGQVQYARLGGTRDGRITAYQLDVVQDAGAYPLIGAVLPGMTMRMTTGVYDIDNVGFSGVSVVTNAVSTTAFRGAGRPEAAVAIERMVDRFAAEIGMDPAEVRRRNFVPRFAEPYTTGVGTTYDVGDYPRGARTGAGGGRLRRRCGPSRRRAGRPATRWPLGHRHRRSTSRSPPARRAASSARSRCSTAGGCGSAAARRRIGQGHDTTWAMIVADRTGVAIEHIEVVHGDTDVVRSGGLTVGSRSVQIGGTAIAEATAKLVDAARERAADLLEAAVDDVVLDDTHRPLPRGRHAGPRASAGPTWRRRHGARRWRPRPTTRR